MQKRWKSGVDVAKLENLRRKPGIALALLVTMVALFAVTSVNIAAHPWTVRFKALLLGMLLS